MFVCLTGFTRYAVVEGLVELPVVLPPPLHLARVCAAFFAASERVELLIVFLPLRAAARASSACSWAGVRGFLAASLLAF